MRQQQRRLHEVELLVRPRGSAEPHRQQVFKAHAFSRHHAETLARDYASKLYDIGEKH